MSGLHSDTGRKSPRTRYLHIPASSDSSHVNIRKSKNVRLRFWCAETKLMFCILLKNFLWAPIEYIVIQCLWHYIMHWLFYHCHWFYLKWNKRKTLTQISLQKLRSNVIRSLAARVMCDFLTHRTVPPRQWDPGINSGKSVFYIKFELEWSGSFKRLAEN